MRYLAAACVLMLGACGSGGETRAEQPAPTETYVSEVDGLALSYPSTWHRADAPLAAPVGSAVEILGLATTAPATAVQGCSPYPRSTMKALGEGDLVLTLRAEMFEWVEEDLRQPGARPVDLLTRPEMPSSELPGGCGVPGVRQWSADFLEHGRQYTVFLAIRGEPTDGRREELRAMWSSVRLDPIVEPRGEATVGTPYWHVLLTHCGIEATSFNGRGWVADPPLVEGAGNPPSGWGNPFEAGLITLTEPDKAEFTTRHGEGVVSFRPRTPADPEVPPCA